jgi:anti-sigma B factor antagonist
MEAPPLPRWHSTFSAAPEVATSTVHARGTLELFTADLLRGAFDVLIRAGCRKIVLDLTGVTSIDRAAVRMLVAMRHSLRSHHGELTIVGASDEVKAILHADRVNCD